MKNNLVTAWTLLALAAPLAAGSSGLAASKVLTGSTLLAASPGQAAERGRAVEAGIALSTDQIRQVGRVNQASRARRGSWVSHQASQAFQVRHEKQASHETQLSQASETRLLLRRTSDNNANGDPLWSLQLQQNGQSLQRWQAVASAKRHQQLDRRWSPDNGSPLPKGNYRLGAPEPWGHDVWMQLDPLFQTSRSGLGIHNCYPGVGCICIPNRDDLTSLADAVRRYNVKQLIVLD